MKNKFGWGTVFVAFFLGAVIGPKLINVTLTEGAKRVPAAFNLMVWQPLTTVLDAAWADEEPKAKDESEE